MIMWIYYAQSWITTMSQNEFFVDLDYMASRFWYGAKPITTDRDRYFVRKGLVRLFHDSKR